MTRMHFVAIAESLGHILADLNATPKQVDRAATDLAKTLHSFNANMDEERFVLAVEDAWIGAGGLGRRRLGVA